MLFGDVNPSGRLSVTMPNEENEIGFSKRQYPGIGKPYPEAYYTEELLVGYRCDLLSIQYYYYAIPFITCLL